MTVGAEATTGTGHEEPTMVDQVKETTGEAKEKAAEQVRRQVDTRTSKAGEQVIVNGLQKARPGGTVKPVPWNPSVPVSAGATGAQPTPATKGDAKTEPAGEGKK